MHKAVRDAPVNKAIWLSGTYFKVVYVCVEEKDEAEGRDPLAYRASQVKDVVLKIRGTKGKTTA